jgi:hypothetical protein
MGDASQPLKRVYYVYGCCDHYARQRCYDCLDADREACPEDGTPSLWSIMVTLVVEVLE